MQVINRDTLTNKAEILYQHTESGKIIPWSAVRVCEINNIKTIETEPVRHGRWLETDYFDAHKTPIYQCSVCWKEVADNYITLHNFCLHCGAKMDGGKEE